MSKCIDCIEDMFVLLQKKDYRMGGEHANEHGIRVSFPKTTDIEGMPTHKPDFRFMAMPAYLGGRFKIFGIKSYGSNPDNAQKGLPRSILMMQLLDATTGAPLAYMSANILSAMRTGATSGGTTSLTPSLMQSGKRIPAAALFPLLERHESGGCSENAFSHPASSQLS